jgi:protoheme ferro-lyase
MASLHTKIKLYLEANSKTEAELYSDNIELQNDGSGNYIKVWNVSGLAQPTNEQLNALESQADDLETANQIISNRKSEYPSIEDCVHAILDDDLENLQILRQAVKNKFPKENT